MKIILPLLFGIAFLIFTSCEKKVDIEKDTNDIKSVLNQYNKAFETEDMELLSTTVAHDEDMVCFGTDAAERWVGWESLKESLQKQFDAFENTKLSVKDQVIKISQSTDVAWMSYITDAQAEVQGDLVKFEGIRGTAVFEKRDSKWVIVQFHVSVPVVGQAIEY
jgi:ketosteroid isomerase-like protein